MQPFIIFSTSFVLLLSTCSKQVDNPQPKTDDDPCKNRVTVTLVDRTGLNCCTWGLRLPDGHYLTPTNLRAFDIEFKEGKKLSVSVADRPDLLDCCMAGKIVDIKCLKEIR